MRKCKKLSALFLCVCILTALLAGCGGKDSPETDETGHLVPVETEDGSGGAPGGEAPENAKGRFLEKELELPEKIASVLGVRKCDDGCVLLVGYDENRAGLYMERTENQGQDWEEIPLESGQYKMAAINPADGATALIGYSSSIEDKGIVLAASDGTEKTLALDMPEYEGDTDDMPNQILSAGYAAGKLFVVDLNQKLYEVDTESGALKEFPDTLAEDVSGLMPVGGQLAVLTRNGVRFADAKECALCPEDQALAEALGVVSNDSDSPVYPSVLTAGESEQELYYINHDGIFYHRQGGSTIEQLANGELLSVGDGSMGFRELVYFDDGHFMVFATDSLGNDRCYSYVYDADAPAVPEKQLNIYALEDSGILQQAVSAFQKQNQDVFVKKTIGMSGDDGVTAEDAIKRLNTEILEGNGPDVLVLDGLPADSYVEKGILSDIGSLIDEVHQTDGLFTNITDAFREDGAVYQVPLRFYCTVAEKNEGVQELSGAPELLASRVQSLKGDAPVLWELSAELLLYAFYDAYSSTWKTDDGIDTELLMRSLQAAKTLYDLDGYSADDRQYSYSTYGQYHGQTIYGTIETGGYMRASDKAQISIGTLTNVSTVRELYGIERVKAGSFELLGVEGQESFVPLVNLGLSQSAKDPEMAQDFIRLALSADGQRQMTNGFSVNRKAYENECDNGKEYSIGTSGADGNYMGYEVKRLDEEQKQALTAMLERLKTPAWSDRVVQDLVLGEGKSYLYGEQSLEDAVAAIAKKVQLYVSE